MKNPCTHCLHYYEIRGRKVCRSPHLELGGDEFITSVKGKVEAPVDWERSSFGKCGREGKKLEVCWYRKSRYPLWGSVYDENATRLDHYPI